MNVFARADGAWLLFDSAQFAHDGTVLRHHPKAVFNERVRAAIGCNGTTPSDATDQIQRWLSRRRDVTDALAKLPALVCEIGASLDDSDLEGHPPGFRLTMAYWDPELERGRVALIASNESMAASIGTPRPYEVRRCSENFTPRLDPSPWPGVGDFDPRSDGKRLAEMQRRFRWPEDGTVRVGGIFSAIRVHATGCERFEIMRWRDPVGMKIGERNSWFRWPLSVLGGGHRMQPAAA